MNKIIIIVAIAISFYTIPVLAWNEPDSFMGIKFWHPIEESIKRCAKESDWEGPNGVPCFTINNLEPETYDIHVVPSGGLIFRHPKGYTISKNLALLVIESPEEIFSQTVSIFQERYGKPTKTMTETWTSRAGVSVPIQVVLWQGRRISITIRQRGNSIGWGEIIYETDLWKANAGKLREERNKKAAKQL